MLKTNGEKSLMICWKRQSKTMNIILNGIAVLPAKSSEPMPLPRCWARVFRQPYLLHPFHHRAAVLPEVVGVDFPVEEAAEVEGAVGNEKPLLICCGIETL